MLAIIDKNANAVCDTWLATCIIPKHTKGHVGYVLCCMVNLIANLTQKASCASFSMSIPAEPSPWHT